MLGRLWAVPFLLLFPTLAHAHDRATVDACIAASEAGTKAFEKGELRAARRHFFGCAVSTCPTVIRGDCTQRIAEIDAAMPTIVPGAKDERGNDIIDVHIAVDGENVHTEGRDLALDPGPHVLRFEHPNKISSEVQVVLRNGDRNRPVIATLKDLPQPPTKPPSEQKPFPMKPVIATVIGAGAFGAFGFLALRSSSERERLEGSCSPRCTDDEVSKLKGTAIAADISLGVGVIALALAAYWYFSER